MKLYDIKSSPYAARCRIQIYAKNLYVDQVEMPIGLPADYDAINPIAKVPALEVDGEIIPESSAISVFARSAGVI